MKRLLKISLVLGLLVAGFSGCNDDDGYSLDKFWISYGVIESSDDDYVRDYTIRLDNGSRLLLSANLVPGWPVKNGQRVIANYTILGDSPRLDGTKDYYVRLNMLYDVLSKDVVKQSFINEDTETREDSIGNDPIDVAEAWFGGGYLNITFEILHGGATHFINLVQDDTRISGDSVFLTLRHNAYGDPQAYRGFGYVSFNLVPLVPEGKTELPVRLTWEGYDGKTHSDEGTFKLNASATAPESALRLDQIATSVE